MANTTNIQPRSTAKIAGIAYLVIIFFGIMAEVFIRLPLIVGDDAAATAANVLGSESLFRFGITGDLVMIGADMVVAVALYVLLRPINKHIALFAAFSRLVMDAILGVNLLNLLAALALFNGDGALSAFGTDQLNAAAMVLLDAHALGYSIGLVPFSFAMLAIGYLLWISRYVPRAIATLVSVSGLVYLIGSFIAVLVPSAEDAFAPAFAIPLIAETALALWLIFKGVKTRHPNSQSVPALAVA